MKRPNAGIANATLGAYDADMDMNEAVAKAIGAERSIAGVTVRELAHLAGIPERSLMRVLQAERDIKVNQVEQIARALKLYPHEIIEHAEVIIERHERDAPQVDNVVVAAFGERGTVVAVDSRAAASETADTREDDRSDEDFDG